MLSVSAGHLDRFALFRRKGKDWWRGWGEIGEAIVSTYLHGKRLVFWQIQPYYLALGVKGIEVDVDNDPQGTRCGGERELGEVLECESRLVAARPAGEGQRRGGYEWLGGRHFMWDCMSGRQVGSVGFVTVVEICSRGRIVMRVIFLCVGGEVVIGLGSFKSTSIPVSCSKAGPTVPRLGIEPLSVMSTRSSLWLPAFFTCPSVWKTCETG